MVIRDEICYEKSFQFQFPNLSTRYSRTFILQILFKRANGFYLIQIIHKLELSAYKLQKFISPIRVLESYSIQCSRCTAAKHMKAQVHQIKAL